MSRFFIAFSLFCLTAMHAQTEPINKKFHIGLSLCTTSDIWKKTNLELIQNELRFYPDMQLTIKDANGNCEEQEKHINEFLNEGMDLLIISPNIVNSIKPSINKAYSLGIPIILIDRKVIGVKYTSYVGGDNYKIGYDAGNYASLLLNGKGNIIEIKGVKGSSPTIERSKGFRDAISICPDINIVLSEFGNWQSNGAELVMQKVIRENLKFDLIFAHNDLMAQEAYRFLKKSGLNNKCQIIGVDGLPGPGGGIQSVIDGQLKATFYYPPQIEEVIRIAYKILHKLPYDKENFIDAVLIDLSKAEVLKSQNMQVERLQERIDKQKIALDIEISKYETQRLILIFALVSLLLVLTLVLFIYKAIKDKRIANKLLLEKKNIIENKNFSITQQQNELVQITQKLEEATSSKLAFFTNISHEFKTPLTLIMGPLELLIKSKKFSFENEEQLRLMNRNSLRLLRLVNQLIDFQKQENNQLKLSASKYDLISFLKEKEETFRYLAKSKQIDFQFISEIGEISIWMDHDKLDKVFFNLLSNAFKFTESNGKIEIKLKKPKKSINKIYEQEIQIEIKDSGEGIEERHINKIFDQYFQSKKSHGNIGTGLGLSLSKKFVEMHRGNISVQSKVGIGTTFFIRLPIGNQHLKEDEIISNSPIDNFVLPSLPTLLNENEAIVNTVNIDKVGKPLILIIDDIMDVREYLKRMLINEYEIIEAVNGEQGLKVIEESEPELIICDIIMPVMDGLEMIKKMRADVKLSHIPVILLTAKNSIENEITGLEEGVDFYISKPFNHDYLRSCIRNILNQRIRLKEYYKCNLDFQMVEDNLSRLDKNFIKKIESLINNLENKNDLTVEMLSEKVGISRVHLYRKIKKLTGMSVSELIVALKLKNSINLLRNSNKSISEIAYDVGFSSPSYYTKCFKRQFKLSPTDYRKQN
ncbi:substrate-binding domain-containing protein [Confluentibacter flavum]|uniref:histidine kinase n=1 Tax=Confluentibacter flavum TaxID=1909700 RepID=A0A2N3HK86_9FLAO|nr:substrate-binding domain-containing protein [Confluentibacter flavum]PKQ45389.1 hypothetical protein CSW08_08480 [Confluentibacter flavum]